MKKLLILVVLILMLFTACGTEAPVMPEPEPEQPVHTEQPPVEEQPQVDVPKVPEESEEPQEPEVPEEYEEPVEPEEPEIIETVSYAQAIEEIAAITNQKPQEFAEYAEVWAFPAGKYQTGGEEPISYADAATLLYFAAEKDPEYLNMAHVTREYPELKDIHGETGRYAMYMYKWGVLYGDPPNDWYADIPAEKYNEMLLRAGSPELRLELLPDKLTLLSWKLDEVSYCSCIQTNTGPQVNPAKERLITVLSDWEGLDRALECSYWIQGRKGNVYYLNMFTGMEDGTISFTRCKYDCGIEQGEILETRTLEPYDLYGSETDILRCVCMTDEQKERLDQELLDQYLMSFRGSSEDSFCVPFFEGYTVAYAWPWRKEPAVMLISLHENKLRSESLTWLNDGVWWYGDMLSHSWYHIYSMDISTG